MGEEGIGRRGEREMKRKEKSERREWGEDQYVGVWEGIPIHMQNQRFRQVWNKFREAVVSTIRRDLRVGRLNRRRVVRKTYALSVPFVYCMF